MKFKKSQITLFIILGLVLLFVIGSFFYFTKYVAKKQTGYETTETQKIKTELQPIVNYVTQCLDKTTKEGLVLLGKQGGYLYKHQGGPQNAFGSYLEDYVFVNYPSTDPHQVLYTITPFTNYTAGYYPNAPNYPWVGFPIDATTGVITFEGLFGKNKLPFIDTIKTHLETYIKNNTKKCIHWNIFKEYEITENSLDVNLEIAKEDLAVRLTYPLTIKNKVTGDTTDIQDFFVREKVRLKKIHDAINNLIENDIRNIEFNIQTDASFESGLSVQVIGDFYDKDDIIIVEDTNSLINKIPYKFIFARRNRRPALEEIPSATVISASTNCTPPYIVAYDPDEDAPLLTFTCNLGTVTVTDGELEDYQTGVTTIP